MIKKWLELRKSQKHEASVSEVSDALAVLKKHSPETVSSLLEFCDPYLKSYVQKVSPQGDFTDVLWLLRNNTPFRESFVKGELSVLRPALSESIEKLVKGKVKAYYWDIISKGDSFEQHKKNWQSKILEHFPNTKFKHSLSGSTYCHIPSDKVNGDIFADDLKVRISDHEPSSNSPWGYEKPHFSLQSDYDNDSVYAGDEADFDTFLENHPLSYKKLGMDHRDLSDEEKFQTIQDSKKNNLSKIEFSRNKTGIPIFDDMIENPQYHREAKGWQHEIVEMSPSDYVKHSLTIMRHEYPEITEEGLRASRTRHTDLIENLKGVKDCNMPVLRIGNKPSDHYQEGLHRAIAAEQEGHKTIPVMVVTRTPDVKKTEDKLYYDKLKIMESQPLAEMKKNEELEKADNVYYHGSDEDFDTFDIGRIEHGRELGNGAYLTNSPTRAASYGKNVLKFSADIKNPFRFDHPIGHDLANKITAKLKNDVANPYLHSKRVRHYISDNKSGSEFMDQKIKEFKSVDGNPERFYPHIDRDDKGIYIEHSDTSGLDHNMTGSEAYRNLRSIYGDDASQVLRELGHDAIDVGNGDLVVMDHSKLSRIKDSPSHAKNPEDLEKAADDDVAATLPDGPKMLSWARSKIPNPTARVWYLHHYSKDPSIHQKLAPEMEHHGAMMGQNKEIGKIKFSKQLPLEEGIKQLKDVDTEWRKKNMGNFTRPYGEKVIDLGSGWGWYDLKSGKDTREAKAMGHCGTSSLDHTRLYSLRREVKVGSDTYHEPHLTFEVGPEGLLFQAKGRGNAKPHPKYHKAIIPLLESDHISHIVGGDYQPEADFDINDLSPDQQKDLLSKKPEISLDHADTYEWPKLSAHTKALNIIQRYYGANEDGEESPFAQDKTREIGQKLTRAHARKAINEGNVERLRQLADYRRAESYKKYGYYSDSDADNLEFEADMIDKYSSNIHTAARLASWMPESEKRQKTQLWHNILNHRDVDEHVIEHALNDSENIAAQAIRSPAASPRQIRQAIADKDRPLLALEAVKVAHLDDLVEALKSPFGAVRLTAMSRLDNSGDFHTDDLIEMASKSPYADMQHVARWIQAKKNSNIDYRKVHEAFKDDMDSDSARFASESLINNTSSHDKS